MLHGISPFFPEILRFVGIVTVALARELTTKFCEVHFNNVWKAFGKIFWTKLTEKATLW